jgi:hypothetical protein
MGLFDQLLDAVVDVTRTQFTPPGGGVRKVDEDFPSEDDLGPVVEELIDRGFLPREVLDLDEPEQNRVVRNLPRAAVAEAVETTMPNQRIMTDFNTFMSIGLDQCGTDNGTFSDLVEVWNKEKDEIREMSPSEVRSNLQCP